MSKQRAPKSYFILFDKYGDWFSLHRRRVDGERNAVGPAFGKKVKGEMVADYTVREYRLVPRSEEDETT